MPFSIIRADITKIKADAVVNAANTSLLGGGGVDGAIHRAAGEKLLKECEKLGGCETGQAKITKGYNMPCKYIIHTVGPIWRGGSNNEENLLYSCYKNSLELAKKHKCGSVAFPLISAGAYGYPKRQALDIAERAIGDFLEDNDIDITLVIFDKEAFKLGGALTDEIKSYIDDNYAEEHYPDAVMRSQSLLNAPSTKPYIPEKKARGFAANTACFEEAYSVGSSLERELVKMDISFSEKLLRLIDERGKKDSDVYNASNISKQVFHKIRSDKNYHPKKNTVLAFSIGLRLTMPETEELLKTAGFALTRSDKTDIIVSYFIERGRYNIHEINEVLFDYDQMILGMNEK